jgi:DNA-binding MarR family transcriptional regulator
MKGKQGARGGSRAAPRPGRRGLPAHAQGRVAYSVGRLDRALRQSMGEITGEFGLTVAQYTALSVLHARAPLSNAQLARRTFVSPQAMNEIVKSLEAKGLVGRAADPDHGRIVRMSLTARGVATLTACDPAVQRLEQRMLGALAPAERARLRRLLELAIAELESAADPA